MHVAGTPSLELVLDSRESQTIPLMAFIYISYMLRALRAWVMMEGTSVLVVAQFI